LDSAKIFNDYIEQTGDPAGKSVMFSPGRIVQVYLVVGSTDMRKSIDSLSILVADRLDLDPFSCYLFCLFLQPEAGYGEGPVLGSQRARCILSTGVAKLGIDFNHFRQYD
jgi:hypothetical protein